MAFVATNKTPGVYIDEVQLPGPIAGVATSNVAIVGPAEKGPTNVPIRVTNPTQFSDRFGGFITSPQMVFATHAVHGFFANGGTTCYFVRIGTARQASRTLMDRSAGAGRPTLTVTAKADGLAGNNINVTVAADSIMNTNAAKPAATDLAGAGASGNQAVVADASNYRPGDIVLVADDNNNERAAINRISGTTIEFSGNLQHAYTVADNGSIRIADLAVNQRKIRLADVTGLEPGSYVQVDPGGNDETHVVASVDKSNGFITFEDGLANNYSMAAAAPDVDMASQEFSLSIGADTFPGLSMDPRHSRYFADAVDAELVDVTAPDDPPNPSVPPDNLPRDLAASPLQNGADDDFTQHTDGRFIQGIDALQAVDAVNMVCVPDNTNQPVQAHMIAHCENLQDRFAILDPAAGADLTAIAAQRNALQSDRGYAALYYPRVKVRDPNPNFDRAITVPPSGHLAGVYARTDEQKGVHKAPANEVIIGVQELETTLTDVDAGIANEQSINVLRFFRGRGFRVWGGRTIASSTQWRYVNVRRLMLFIEESIQEGTEAFVFDPNNQALWETVKRQVSGFLTGVWQTGALFGEKPQDAFRVRIDHELNPAETLALGQLHIEVIVFPTTPAEFIVFRIIQEPGGPRLVEL